MEEHIYLGSFRGEKMYGNKTAEKCFEYLTEQATYYQKECTELEQELFTGNRKTFLQRLFS